MLYVTQKFHYKRPEKKKKEKNERLKKKLPVEFFSFLIVSFQLMFMGKWRIFKELCWRESKFVHADLNAAFLFLVKRFVVIIEVHGLLHEGICIFFPMEEEIILKEFYPLLVILRSASILLNLDNKCKLSFYFVFLKKSFLKNLFFSLNVIKLNFLSMKFRSLND